MPLEHVVPEDWRDAVVDPDTGLVERIPYELCVLVALSKPRDPADFVADIKKRHVAALDRLNMSTSRR